jgi:NitT/TauT family transport system permease protein
LVIVCFVAAWQLAADTGLISKFFISSPSAVGQRIWDLGSEGSLFSHSWVTMREALKGYTVGVLAGVTIGFVLGHSRFLSAAFLPILNLLNTLPRIALAPLFIIWFGIGETSKVVLVMSVVVVVMIFNTYAGTQTVDRDLVTNARLLGANRLQMVRKVTFPWTLPWILAGLRIALAWSLGAAVVAEYIASNQGLGFYIFKSSSVLDQTGVLAGCVALLCISGLIFAVLGAVERVLLRWRPPQV